MSSSGVGDHCSPISSVSFTVYNLNPVYKHKLKYSLGLPLPLSSSIIPVTTTFSSPRLLRMCPRIVSCSSLIVSISYLSLFLISQYILVQSKRCVAIHTPPVVVRRDLSNVTTCRLCVYNLYNIYTLQRQRHWS